MILSLLSITTGWVPRPINCPFYVASDSLLASVKLRSNHSVTGQRSSNLLSNLSNGAVGIKLLADRACGGEN